MLEPVSRARDSCDLAGEVDYGKFKKSPPGQPARDGGRRPRVLEEAGRLQEDDRADQGRAALRLLRGTADGERPARHPSRAGARVQGHLPALQDHARLLRLAQGRLGHARPAGRAGGREEARLLGQEGHRGLRHHRVQPEVPPERVRLRRGLGEAHRAHGLLGRPADRVPHATPTTTSNRSGGSSSSTGIAG